MRLVHAAIEHWRRGDFECAITLAGAAERMLPEIDEPRYRELQDIARVNEISDWLIHGKSRDGAKSECADRIVIEELDTVSPDGRIFVNFPRWSEDTPVSVTTLPKRSSKTPRKSNQAKTGSKQLEPATRTSTTIGKSGTIGLSVPIFRESIVGLVNAGVRTMSYFSQAPIELPELKIE
jgi:hypothetical protein